jgi:ankyrin repeat protein
VDGCDALALHEAFVQGDLEAVKALLGNPSGFPNCTAPIGMGCIVLEYAIYHGPFPFIETLLDLGADPDYPDHVGYPSLIAALSSGRQDRLQILDLLLAHGADIQQHGANGYTPLHWAAGEDDPQLIDWLLARGADPDAQTNVDDYTTPLEEAAILGKERAASALRAVVGRKVNPD